MIAPSHVMWVHYLPVVTTAVAILFCLSLFRRYRERRAPHLLWWAAGVAFYGLGTLIEATITVGGNMVLLNKVWYIAGAILGGYPLAQGSLFLSYSRRFARRATAVSLPFVLLACWSRPRRLFPACSSLTGRPEPSWRGDGSG